MFIALTTLVRVDKVRKAIEYAQGFLTDYAAEAVRISEIPAPTFAEGRRAAYIRDKMIGLGLDSVHLDSVGNVIGQIRGRAVGRGKPADKQSILLAAHLDTVFPLETDCRVRRDGRRLYGPGIGDNASNLAGMLFLARALKQGGVTLHHDLIFAGTVCEEGLGDLNGMKRVVEDWRGRIGLVLVIDGNLGSLVHQGVGSRRLRIFCRSEGGHSWGAFGTPSAIHALGRIISRISDLEVPRDPRTTYNIGLISGGTSVNTIAPNAELFLDLRSVGRGELLSLESAIHDISREVGLETGVGVGSEILGDRPVGAIPFEHPLCQAVRRAHRHLGMESRPMPSSTDANIPLSLGIPAVSVGTTTGGNGHRVDEYIHLDPAITGIKQLILLVNELDDPDIFNAAARFYE